MQTLEQVKEKVQRILMENYPVRLAKDDGFHINYESAHVFIVVRERTIGENRTDFLVHIFCPLTHSFEITSDLCKWVAINGQDFLFGHVQLINNQDGYPQLIFSHTILAVDLDESELLNAVGAVLHSSANLITELHQKYGGQLFGKD